MVEKNDLATRLAQIHLEQQKLEQEILNLHIEIHNTKKKIQEQKTEFLKLIPQEFLDTTLKEKGIMPLAQGITSIDELYNKIKDNELLIELKSVQNSFIQILGQETLKQNMLQKKQLEQETLKQKENDLATIVAQIELEKKSY